MRQKALDAIPPGAGVDFRTPLTLATWQARGTYTISFGSSTRFTVEAAPADFGGALLSDAAYHLDHALEHQATLMKSLLSGQWSSPAWHVVTIYYWAYFAGMALSRLLGRTVWFITPEVAKQFTALAPTGSPPLTKGTYELSFGTALSAGTRQILLAKRTRRVHEQLWATTFDLFNELYLEVGAGVATPQEERMFLSIINSAHALGTEWPSALRNLVNYRPGFAYTAPRFINSVDSYGYLTSQQQTIDRLIDRLENGNLAMRADPDISARPQIAARMLADLTILLSRIAHALHDDVVDRAGGDRRWLGSKRRFAQQQGLLATGAPWPC